MGKGLIVFLIILLAFLVAVLAVVLYIIKKVGDISGSMFGPGIKNFVKGMKQQEAAYSSLPKTVASMTSVYAERIASDFPDFSLPLFKQRAENMLHSYFLALDSRDILRLEGASESLKAQVRAEIEQLALYNQDETITNIVIHRTEIARYTKADAVCTIVMQSAVGYRRYVTDESGRVVRGRESVDVQERFDTEFVYIRDYSKAVDSMGGAASVVCSSCGAPIASLGDRRCSYCGAAVVVDEERVWLLSRVTLK